MSTNKSEHLNLHLWEPEDDFLRTEFNENFTALDGAVKTVTTAVSKAQSTADAAQTAADVSPYAVGSYVGTGTAVTVTLGFRPKFVIICGHKEGDASNTDEKILYAFGATGGNVLPNRIQLTDTGFIACARVSYMLYPDFSISGRTYDYIAFR